MLSTRRLLAIFFIALLALATAAPAAACPVPPRFFPCQPFPACILA